MLGGEEKKKNPDKRKKREAEINPAKVQRSADNMLSIKSDQSRREGVKEGGVKVKREFNQQESVAMVFTVMGYCLCSLQIRTLSCDSSNPLYSC